MRAECLGQFGFSETGIAQNYDGFAECWYFLLADESCSAFPSLPCQCSIDIRRQRLRPELKFALYGERSDEILECDVPRVRVDFNRHATLDSWVGSLRNS